MRTINLAFFIINWIVLSLILFMLLNYVLFNGQEVTGMLAVLVLIVFFGASFWLCWKLSKNVNLWLKRKSRLSNVWFLITQVFLLAVILGGFQSVDYFAS